MGLKSEAVCACLGEKTNVCARVRACVCASINNVIFRVPRNASESRSATDSANMWFTCNFA